MSCFHSFLALHESFFLLLQSISPNNSVLGYLSICFSGALADLPVGFPGSILVKVCRQSRKTFLFLFCFFLFFFLSYFSLPPSASLDFSLISQLISLKFSMLIVLDETKRCLKLQVNRTRGRDRAWSQSFTMLYNRTNSIYCA